MLTDTRRVELAMPPALAWTIVKQIMRNSQLTEAGQARANRVLSLLYSAAHEPLRDLLERDHRKLSARLDRTVKRLCTNLTARDCSLVEALHALHEALRVLIETGAVAMVDGGAFDLGWLALKDWIFDPTMDDGQGFENERVFDRTEARGRTLGHELLALFQRQGLYRAAIGEITFGGRAAAPMSVGA